MNSETKPTIIVCLDSARNSDLSLLYACHLAKKSDFAVQILVVIESAKSLLFVSKAIGKERRTAVEKQLKKLIEHTHQETGIIPIISIREGDVVREISAEVKANPNCIMLVFGKSYNYQSDNNVLPKLSAQIGSKIKVPVVIVPDNLGSEYLKKLF
ncbi:MAG: universal stress protein [Pseudomonadota bacterium]